MEAGNDTSHRDEANAGAVVKKTKTAKKKNRKCM
jgi:hypothetical protein